jgi:hypothetical protein
MEIPLRISVQGVESRKSLLVDKNKGASFTELTKVLEATLGEQYVFPSVKFAFMEDTAQIKINNDDELRAAVILWEQLPAPSGQEKRMKLLVEKSDKPNYVPKKVDEVKTPVKSQEQPEVPKSEPKPAESKATKPNNSDKDKEKDSDSKSVPPSNTSNNNKGSPIVQPRSTLDGKASTTPVSSSSAEKKPEALRLQSMDVKNVPVIEKPLDENLVLSLRCENPKKDVVVKIKCTMTLAEFRSASAGWLETQVPVHTYEFAIVVYGNDVRVLTTADNKQPIWQLGFQKWSTVFAFVPTGLVVNNIKAEPFPEMKGIIKMFPQLHLEETAVIASYIAQNGNAGKVQEHWQNVATVKEVFTHLDNATIAEALANESGNSKTKCDRVIEKLLSRH